MSLVNHDPRAMTWQAQAYLGICALRHLILGVSCIVAPHLYTGRTFVPMINYFPLIAWGLIMCLVGVAAGAGSLFRHARLARIGIMASATISLVLGAAVAIGFVQAYDAWLAGLIPTPVSPVLPVLLLAVAAKDYVICSRPIRSPFASILQSGVAKAGG